MSAWIKTAVQPRLTFPTLTGSIVTFNSQYAGLPLKSHTVDIDSVSGVSAINIGSDAKYAGFIDFNQIVKNGNFVSTSNWTAVSSTFSVSDNVATVQPSALNGRIGQYVPFPLGHKMLTILDFKGASGITYGFNGLVPATTGTGDWVELSKIMESPVQSNQAYLFAGHQSNDGFSNPFYVKNVRLFDLTQMFGSTKADEIYNMEQQTAGSGVAYVRSLFPNDYYEYNAGTLTTVSAANGLTNSFFTIPIGSTVNEATYNARTGVLEVTLPSVQTIQLPPCPIDVLEGVNNIWADTGDTTLQYPKFG